MGEGEADPLCGQGQVLVSVLVVLVQGLDTLLEVGSVTGLGQTGSSAQRVTTPGWSRCVITDVLYVGEPAGASKCFKIIGWLIFSLGYAISVTFFKDSGCIKSNQSLFLISTGYGRLYDTMKLLP